MVDEDASLILSQMQRETLDKPIEAMPGMETSEVERDDWARLFTGKLNEEGSFPRTLRDLTRALAEIARLKSDLTTAELLIDGKNTRIIELNQRITDQSREIAHLTAKLTARDEHMELLRRDLGDKERRIADLTAALADTEFTIDALKAMHKAALALYEEAVAREARAREEEREACAKIGDADPFLTGHGMAIRIRARTTP